MIIMIFLSILFGMFGISAADVVLITSMCGQGLIKLYVISLSILLLFLIHLSLVMKVMAIYLHYLQWVIIRLWLTESIPMSQWNVVAPLSRPRGTPYRYNKPSPRLSIVLFVALEGWLTNHPRNKVTFSPLNIPVCSA